MLWRVFIDCLALFSLYGGLYVLNIDQSADLEMFTCKGEEESLKDVLTKLYTNIPAKYTNIAEKYTNIAEKYTNIAAKICTEPDVEG